MEIFNPQLVYGVCFVIFAIGLYIAITANNYIKKLFGLSIFQSSVMLLFIAIGYIKNGSAPIINPNNANAIYVNPLPQVLMLTAIVVGLATLAVGLALCIRINKKFGTLEDKVHDE